MITWNRETIQSILANAEGYTGGKANRYLIYRMLQGMFERQTHDEQITDQTNHLNGVGFNGVDAPLLSDVAKRSKPYNNLTVKQAAMVGRRLKKYVGQLEDIAALKAKPSTCGACGEGLTQCRCYFKAEHQKLERQQEEFAFLSGMQHEEALQ